MKKITYIEQPTCYLCGQACVAMLADVSVEDVIAVIHNDKGTGKKELSMALDYYGVKHAKTMTKADNATELPETCLLKVLLPGYGHWVLFHNGKYYDPEFGLLEERYSKEKVQAYWEIFLEQ